VAFQDGTVVMSTQKWQRVPHPIQAVNYR